MSELHVVFGAGPLAQAVMRALVKRGRTVQMINRSGRRPAAIPAAVAVVAGDAYQPEFTRAVLRGAVAAYQCAQPEYHEWAAKFPPLQAAILEGAAAAGVKLIVAENLYMYGDVDGRPLREDLPYAAHTRKGRVRAQMAQALLDAHRAGRARVAMARGSDFFGPGVLASALGERALIPLLQGRPAEAVAALDQPHAFTYINDFGEALAILGERDEALGRAWHVPNAPALTQRQLLGAFFQQAGRPPRYTVMGRFMLALGGLFVPAAREMVEMAYEFEKPFHVDASQFVQAFGDIATPTATAVRETVAWYQAYLSAQPGQAPVSAAGGTVSDSRSGRGG